MVGAVVRSRAMLACLFAMTIVMLAPGAPAATAATLSGTVSGQTAAAPAQPIGGATVAVVDRGSGSVVESDTTDAAGAYSIVVQPGVYDVRFSPAPAQMLAPTTIHDVDLGDDRQLDVVLVPAGAVRLSGAVRDAAGAPVVGVRVGLTARGAPQVVTDAEGRYELVSSPRSDARLKVEGREPVGGLPRQWDVATVVFALVADRVLDVRLPPLRRVTVRVLGEDGAPLEGATVRLPELRGVEEQVGDLAGRADTLSGDGVTTGPDGEAVFDTFGGDPGSTGTVVPAAGGGYGSVSFTFGTVVGDATVEVRPPRAVRLSGVVRDAAGAPVVGVRVGLTARGAQQVVTDAEGRYELVSSPHSEARLKVEGREPVAGLPEQWDLTTTGFQLVADEVLDVRLPPLRRVTVRVLGEDGAPLEGATVWLPELRGVEEQVGDLAGRADTLSLDGVTGVDGTVVFDTFGGDPRSTGTVTPAAGGGYGSVSFTFGTVVGDTTVEVRPPRAVRLSGVVRDAAGVPVVGVRVGLTARGAPQVVTDAEGRYGFAVSPRSDARLKVEGREPVAGRPRQWDLTTVVFPLVVDQVLDMRLPPLRRVTVRVLGEDGGPLEGATVRLPELSGVEEQVGDLAGWADTLSGDGVSTGPDGVAVFDTFGGDPGSTGTVVPPSGSDYANARFPIPTVLADTTILVRFQSVTDFLAPEIDCVQPTGGWSSEEAVVRCTAADFPSGLADPADAEFELATAVGDGGEDAAAFTASREVCDFAGNCATAGPFGPFQVDRHAPRIRFDQQPNGLQGWFVTSPGSATAIAEDASIATLDCALAGNPVGVPPEPSPGALSITVAAAGEGRHQVECSAADEAGHLSSAAGEILIDRTRPRRPTATTDRSPDFAGRGGWYRDAVTVSLVDRGDPDLADGSPGSGIDLDTSTQPQLVSESGAHTVSGSVADLAGNRSLERSLTVRVDADPPQSDLRCPATIRRGLPGFARWTDRDGESGIAGLPAGLALLDSSTLGSHSFSHTAVDNVGHSTTVTCDYVVIPLFG